MPYTINKQDGADNRTLVFYSKAEMDSILGFDERLTERGSSLLGNSLGSVLVQLDERLEELNEGQLQDLQDELDTLDGYFEDPSTIPATYTFFEGIVTEQAYIDALAANTAWVDSLTANTAWIDSITANEGWFDQLAANDAFIEELFANNITVTNVIQSDNYIADSSGFLIDGSTGNAEFNDVTARGEFIGIIDPTNDEDLIAGLGLDDRYLNEDENLSDLSNASTAQTNLGLTDGTADLDFNSLDISSVSFVDSSRNLTATTGSFSDTLTANSLAVFNDEIDANADVTLHDSTTNINTDTFVSGFAGTGLAFLNNGTWDGTLDNLTVRQRMRVYELLISQIRATNGSVVVSSAGEVALPTPDLPDTVTSAGGDLDWTSSDPFWTESDEFWFTTYRLYIEEDKFVPFVEGDLVISQRFTGSGTYLVEGTVVAVENGSGTVTDNSTRRYFDIALTGESDIPTAGMEFVRWGNLTDSDRQGLLYLTGDDDEAPYMDIVYGLDSHDARNSQDTIKGRLGRLDGIIDSDFPSLDGSQNNLFGVYIDGGYFNNVEVRGKITILDTIDSNAATKQYVNDAVATGSGEGNQIIRSTSEPTQRVGGEPLVTGDMWIDTDDGDKPYSYDGSDFIRAYTIIDGGDLETGSISADKISIGSVTDLDSDAALITDIVDDYNDLINTPSLGDVASLDSITSTYISNGAVVTAKIATGAVIANRIDVTNLQAVNTNTGSLTVDDTLTVTGGNVLMGANVYNSPSIGNQNGILTDAGLFSDQGVDLDARAGTAGEIEWHDTNQSGDDDLTSNTNLVGELQVDFNGGDQISNFLMRAQTVGAGWDSHISLSANRLNILTSEIDTTAEWIQPIIENLGTESVSNAETNIFIQQPVTVVTGGGGSTRIARIDTPDWTPTNGQTITVINALAGTNFGWRDETTTGMTGANIRCDLNANYDHRSWTKMTLTYYNGFYYIDCDHGA